MDQLVSWRNKSKITILVILWGIFIKDSKFNRDTGIIQIIITDTDTSAPHPFWEHWIRPLSVLVLKSISFFSDFSLKMWVELSKHWRCVYLKTNIFVLQACPSTYTHVSVWVNVCMWMDARTHTRTWWVNWEQTVFSLIPIAKYIIVRHTGVYCVSLWVSQWYVSAQSGSWKKPFNVRVVMRETYPSAS